jgi:hypothetical protein
MAQKRRSLSRLREERLVCDWTDALISQQTPVRSVTNTVTGLVIQRFLELLGGILLM